MLCITHWPCHFSWSAPKVSQSWDILGPKVLFEVTWNQHPMVRNKWKHQPVSWVISMNINSWHTNHKPSEKCWLNPIFFANFPSWRVEFQSLGPHGPLLEVLDRFESPTAAPAPTKALVLGIWQQHLQMAPRGAQWRPSVFCLSFFK